MIQKVTYIKKCMKCGNLAEYIMRDANVNSPLTDLDIYDLIARHVESPYTSDCCEKCKMQTLQMTVGWKY